MPPTKVCPQCKAAVPVRRKTCDLQLFVANNTGQSVLVTHRMYHFLAAMCLHPINFKQNCPIYM